MKKYDQKKIQVFLSFILCFISIWCFSQTASPDKFHDTKGNIEVTKAGQLQYTLAIDTPPGIQKTSPAISLAYVSGATNGLAGYGWNISGVSAISRIGKNLEKDGVTKGVQLDDTDSYSFNGQRLILKSGEYGKDGAEYVTEKYSNIRIRSIGAVTGQSWQGPEYWEVTFDDGSQAWYGATASGDNPARTPIDYNIVKSTDSNGNYITYNYVAENNVSVISTIEWGGNETQNTPHFNKIEFAFIPRPKSETAYLKGAYFSQSKLLESIVVSTNGKQYKKYNISYKTDQQKTAYRYLNKITVVNSKNEEANPVLFTYEKSYGSNIQLDHSAGKILKFNSDTDVVGDFDGDGTLDLLRYHSVTSAKIPQTGLYLYRNFYLLYYDSQYESPIFIGSSLSELKDAVAVNLKKNNIIRNRQGFVIMKQVNVNNTYKRDLELSFYSIAENNELTLDFKKTIPNTDYDNSDEGGQNGTTTTIKGIKNVDFNGDGLSELVLQLNDRVCRLTDPQNSAKLPHTCVEYGRYFVIDPDESIQNNNWYYPLSLYATSKEDPFITYRAGDFNGDGTFDFMKLDQSKKPLLITFKKNIEGKYKSSISPFNPTNNEEVKGVWEDALVGDYNGDGISDIMIPVDGKSAFWYTYTSKGNAFKEEITPFMRAQKDRQVLRDPNENFKIYNPRTFVAYDINNDGKTDLISLESQRLFYRRTDLDNSSGAGYQAKYQVLINVLSIFGGIYNPLDVDTGGGNYNINNNINSFIEVNSSDLIGVPVDLWTGAMLKQVVMASIGTTNHPYGIGQVAISSKYFDIAMEGRINSISQGGITTEITYKQLDKKKNPGLYNGVKTENYPYVEINQSTGMYVVSQMTQTTTSDKKLKQDFRYRGLTSNILGRGMIGFRKTARSSWYADGFENTKVWTGAEIDPLNEGVPVKQWSMRTNDESKIFPADVSENNADLLSFTSTVYQVDKLLNGQVVTSIADADKAKVVTAILPKITKSKDFLTGTISENTITYGQYYLPSASSTSVNGNFGVSTKKFTYTHNSSGQGKDYYIGRLIGNINENKAYSDTHKMAEYYIYENNHITTTVNIAGEGLNNIAIINELTYDGFGNTTGKVTKIGYANDPTIRTEKSEYDPTGRFVVKKTDNLGLVTSIDYNDWGQVISQIDPLGNTLSNTYDGWGKLLTSTTNLDGITTYSYDRDNNSNVTITQYEPDGNVSKTFTNKLGQEYKSSTKAFGQGQFVSKETLYDVLGRKTKMSEPYFEGQSASQWNTIVYDDSVFPAKVTSTAFNGKQTETTISGLTTTVRESGTDDYGRITSKTADVLGNIISSTDKGGTIEFSYNAVGKQIQARYAENTVTTKYDVWGRKTEFNDPSNGLYKYEYNGFGQLLKTTSPKGTKQYTYNSLGQLISQKEFSTIDGGQTTNRTISFTYNDKGLLIAKSGQIKWQLISTVYTYDPQGRLLSSSEKSNDRTYSQKGITYDDKGKIISYEKELQSYGASTKVTIENVYSAWNGELYQVKDKNSGKILWELKEANARGQVVKAGLGAVNVNNTYNNTTGMLQEIMHSSSSVQQPLLNIQYTFNAIRNELTLRKTLGSFNIIESFNYDDNNRLTSWTNPKTGMLSENAYDIKGRIMKNDQVGSIKYENAAKIYQSTGMTLNATGTQNYNTDLIQTIVYNENNDPVQINGQKARIRFEYGLGNMRQRVDIEKPKWFGGGTATEFVKTENGVIDPNQPVWQSTITKFYSEDGSFEIVRDQTTNQEKYILYIGGTPYESNIVYLKDFGQTVGSYKFLHKDYLGTILAISDEGGNKVEQRHFDAWGNLTALTFGNTGAVITDKNIIDNSRLLIDRGYTSHEYFAEVGIIHMNGRLYDPLLRRFLSADENIQDPNNTQNYNKYGYVLNNPLMYNDPDGEFWMWLAGALIGGYLNGVAANNGKWNPGKWDWQNTWSAVLGGAIGGAAVSGAIGNIASNAGAIKSFLPGIVSGGLSSAFNGGNFLGGVIGGISYSASVFENKMTSTNMVDLGYRYILNNEENSDNWIAPFGEKFKTIENVLKGDRFESYENNGNVCFRAAKAQTINGGGNPSGPLQALQTLIDNPYQAARGGDQLKLSYVAAIKTLMSELNNNRPSTIGVTYARNEVGNHNRITDHFITVVGMGYDSSVNRNFFSFYDNVGNTTNLQTNRLYIYPNRTITGQGYGNNIYYMTEVRPNIPKPNYFNSSNIFYYKQYP